jgi:hypothetical protein
MIGIEDIDGEGEERLHALALIELGIESPPGQGLESKVLLPTESTGGRFQKCSRLIFLQRGEDREEDRQRYDKLMPTPHGLVLYTTAASNGCT